MLIQRPTNRRAGCEKIARPVRREGQGQIPCSYPYPTLNAKMRIVDPFVRNLDRGRFLPLDEFTP